MEAKIGKRQERALRTIKQVTVERPWASERWLRRAIYEKRFRYFKVDGRVLIDLADLDAYAERGQVDAARSA